MVACIFTFFCRRPQPGNQDMEKGSAAVKNAHQIAGSMLPIHCHHTCLHQNVSVDVEYETVATVPPAAPKTSPAAT